MSAACTPGGRYGAHSTQRPFGARVPVGASLSGVTTRQIPPSSVDPAESGPSDPNVIMLDSSATPNGLLLVFLAGSAGRPGCCQMFLGAAAQLGFHTIGLTYNNRRGVGPRCRNDLHCYGSVRQNVFDGSDPSSASSVAPESGVEHRLSALLSYLASNYPDEGWDQFLTNTVPAWNSIVLSGHSQGGGEAAYIGSLRSLAGVISLSSPEDTNDALQPAVWLASPQNWPTPIGGYFTFSHVGDPFLPRTRADWTALGLDALGPPTSVDGTGPPYGGSHELISSAALPRVFLANHNSTAVDRAQPLCASGTSMYLPVWQYLLQSAAGLSVPAPPAC